MTKPRPPLTVDLALTRIAALIGWDAMAIACNQSERTVRNWSDPDTRERCPVEAGIALDLAYQQAGGEGAPIYETYGLLLEAARAERFRDQAQLAAHTMTVIRESAEAHAALVAASRTGATDADRRLAAKEVQEAVTALTQTIPVLTGGDVSPGSSGDGEPCGGAIS